MTSGLKLCVCGEEISEGDVCATCASEAFCPECGQEIIKGDCFGCKLREKQAVEAKKREEKKGAPTLSVDLARYLGHNNIRGERRERALAWRHQLLEAGFELIDSFAWWLVYDSGPARVFLDPFNNEEYCLLMWKDQGSVKTGELVLGKLTELGIKGRFPYSSKLPAAKVEDLANLRIEDPAPPMANF